MQTHNTVSASPEEKGKGYEIYFWFCAIPLLTSEFHALENEVRKSMTGSKATLLLWWAAALLEGFNHSYIVVSNKTDSLWSESRGNWIPLHSQERGVHCRLETQQDPKGQLWSKSSYSLG